MVLTRSPLAEYESIAREHYNVVGEASTLPGYVDINTRIDTVDTSFVLRISHEDTDVRQIELCEAALAATGSGSFTTPRLVRTRDGARFTRHSDGSYIRLHTWVKGVNYAHSGHPSTAAHSIGRTAGEMVELLSGIDTAVVRTDTKWDLRYALETIDNFSSHLTSDTQRRTISTVREYLEAVQPTNLPLQVIHGDLNTGNLLLDGDDVVGVIDFGDVRRSFRIAELAIACAYVMLGQGDPVSVAAQACCGYREVADVSPSEADQVFSLILARLGTSVCIAAANQSGNEQHHDTEDASWDLLDRLTVTDIDRISQEITAALVSEQPRPSGTDELRKARSVLAPSLSLSYNDPLHIVSGRGQYLYDERGRRFLDCVNNVAHVGHSHPSVTQAAVDQMRVLNTNTRYLHTNITRYAQRLTSTMPDQLNTVFLVNSGSEANELAIRLARTATDRYDVACIDHGYHGNTTTLISVSPYKFNGPGGDGQPDWVHVLPSLDGYRQPRYTGSNAASNYATDAATIIADVDLSALIIEALPGCGGQVVPVSGVLAAAYSSVRDRGALIIADEVQTGMGRVGRTFWAFQLAGVQPDIVTIGKPAGNGHPLAAVVTTRAIAESFDTGMEYFNTFGGNPVSAAVGNAVFDVIEGESLQENALKVGNVLLAELGRLAERHTCIGDVRGAGLFLGVEFVKDRTAQIPDSALVTRIVEYAKARSILLSVDGPHNNVLKIKPPLVFDLQDADHLMRVLDKALVALCPTEAGPHSGTSKTSLPRTPAHPSGDGR